LNIGCLKAPKVGSIGVLKDDPSRDRIFHPMARSASRIQAFIKGPTGGQASEYGCVYFFFFSID
jgi:hypothetical protein